MGWWKKFKRWRATRKAARRRSPRRGLSYKSRVRDDVEVAYKTEEGKKFFDDKYTAALTASVQNIEKWQIKLLAYQYGLMAFVVVGFLSPDASYSLFGVPLKSAPGIKELVLSVLSLLAVPVFALDHTRQLRLIVLEKLTELTTNKNLVDLAKLGTVGHFNLAVYVPKQYDNWIFPTLFTKASTFMLMTLGALWYLVFFLFSCFVWGSLMWQVWSTPTLGGWSVVVVVYALGTGMLCLLWLLRAHFPMRFRDERKLKEIAALQDTDPAAYEAALRELYEPRPA